MKVLSLVLVMLVFTGCSSMATKTKLSKDKIFNNSTVVFGKIIDLNPESDPSQLQITYALSDKSEESIIRVDNNFPKLDPESNYFWVAIPDEEVKYFGIKSIRYGINGMTSKPMIRDEKTHKPLFGIPLKGRNGAVYVGEIVIRSYTKKLNAGFSLDIPDIKEVTIRNNAKEAKEFIGNLGIDSDKMTINPFVLNKKM
jgi:hypothetical protein